MTPFEGKGAAATIFSSLEDIEKGRKIYFLLKGKGLTIDYLIPIPVTRETDRQ